MAPSSVEERRRSDRTALMGWLAVLVCSLLVYDALLFSSLINEEWKQQQASARVAVDHLRMHLSTGVRFGKKLENYRGMDQLLQRSSEAADLPIAVLDAQGHILRTEGDFSSCSFFGGKVLDVQKGVFLRDTPSGRPLIRMVLDREHRVAGYLAAFISRDNIRASLLRQFGGQLAVQLFSAAAGALLFAWILALRRRGSPDEEADSLLKKRRRLSIAVFLLVMIINGMLALGTVGSRYRHNLENDARRTGELLTGTLNRLLLVGMTFERMDNVDAYMADVAAAHDNTIALELISPEGQRKAGSLPEGTELLDHPALLPLLSSGHAGSLHLSDEHIPGWTLRVSLVKAPWIESMRSTALDMLTMVAVSLIFMVELFLLLARALDFRRARQGKSSNALLHPLRSALIRPLGFFMVFAMDMSISFIPLRMAELVPEGSLSRDMLMGLPISAEMGMTGLSVLVAGAWLRRSGARPPYMVGLACIALGYAASMLATAPWHFIAARAVVGLGYGLALLTAQAYTVRDGLLADMFAGVYAGSLCGSAMGAMLAERFGYAPVFLLSALILLCLVPLPRLLLQKGRDDDGAQAEVSLTFAQIRRLLCDRRLLAFVVLTLIPSAMLCVGFLNYFLPIYLNQAGTSQSDIGRIYMLNCLLVIYSGPPLSRLVMKARSKSLMVCIAGIISGISLLGLAILPPLPATLLGSILVGLATGLNIPAQSEFLLKLEVARAIGIDQSMSLLDAMQRVGQVLGPLCAGMALQFMDVDEAARDIGTGFILMSLLFLLLVKMPCGRAKEEER